MPNTNRNETAAAYQARSTALYLCLGHALGILSHPSIRVALAQEVAKDPAHLGKYVAGLRDHLAEVLPGGVINMSVDE